MLIDRPSEDIGLLIGNQNLEPASLRELEQELLPSDNVRNVRDNVQTNIRTPSSVYQASLQGLLPHQKRKSAPYYGRRSAPYYGRRRRATQGAAVGWTILDPVTGREIKE